LGAPGKSGKGGVDHFKYVSAFRALEPLAPELAKTGVVILEAGLAGRAHHDHGFLFKMLEV
jgi:hypothetical protein